MKSSQTFVWSSTDLCDVLAAAGAHGDEDLHVVVVAVELVVLGVGGGAGPRQRRAALAAAEASLAVHPLTSLHCLVCRGPRITFGVMTLCSYYTGIVRCDSISISNSVYQANSCTILSICKSIWIWLWTFNHQISINTASLGLDMHCNHCIGAWMTISLVVVQLSHDICGSAASYPRPCDVAAADAAHHRRHGLGVQQPPVRAAGVNWAVWGPGPRIVGCNSVTVGTAPTYCYPQHLEWSEVRAETGDRSCLALLMQGKLYLIYMHRFISY